MGIDPTTFHLLVRFNGITLKVCYVYMDKVKNGLNN